jgi:hypothetical protein
MGGASRADRYRLLVGESGVEGIGAGIGLLPDDQVPSTVQSTKHPSVRFNIFVAENGTRRVELART